MLVPVALNQAYSYRVPRGMDLKPGDVVCVPLGPREVTAVVWAENANPDPRCIIASRTSAKSSMYRR